MAGLGSKSLTIIWTEPALADLDQIADYIALDKPDTANRLVLRIFESVERLAHFPKSGSCSKELQGTTYRHLAVPPLRLFYRLQTSQIFIIYVMRGEKLFLHEDLIERDR
jgi:toxin ParE1/3/4